MSSYTCKPSQSVKTLDSGFFIFVIGNSNHFSFIILWLKLHQLSKAMCLWYMNANKQNKKWQWIPYLSPYRSSLHILQNQSDMSRIYLMKAMLFPLQRIMYSWETFRGTISVMHQHRLCKKLEGNYFVFAVSVCYYALCQEV